jgi:hypothetical protein
MPVKISLRAFSNFSEEEKKEEKKGCDRESLGTREGDP